MILNINVHIVIFKYGFKYCLGCDGRSQINESKGADQGSLVKLRMSQKKGNTWRALLVYQIKRNQDKMFSAKKPIGSSICRDAQCGYSKNKLELSALVTHQITLFHGIKPVSWL